MMPVKEAVKFHGHLGPYLILGLIAGDLSLKKLGCKKYFGLKVKVYGANIKPKSCLVDGLQLSTGATYGKGNITKYKAKQIKIIVLNLQKNKKIQVSLKKSIVQKLDSLSSHAESEKFAKKLLKLRHLDLFDIN